jgi:hypothetical protein
MADKPLPHNLEEEQKKEGASKEDWDLEKIERELEECRNEIERSKVVEESKSIAENNLED